MKVTTFTDLMVKKLKSGEKKYIRGEGNGFTIRVMPSGVKTWLYIYSIDGKRRELNLGGYPDVTLETARGRFETARKKVKNGIDPISEMELAQDERRKAPTVSDLVNEYIEKHAIKNKKSWAEDKRCLEKEVIPLWGKRKARDITKRDVVLLLEGIVSRGSPVMANNTLEKVRKMFNFAVERDILEHTPCYGVKKPTKKEHRDRVLTHGEIQTLWNSIESAGISDEIRRALKLILVTAQRPGEVIGMHPSEIDGNWWTIPTSRAKNGRTHRVYLTQTALSLIGSQEGYIFPSPIRDEIGGRESEKPMDVNAVAHAVRRNLEWPMTDKDGNPQLADDGKQVTINRLSVDKFTPHDLRRTAATGIAALGFADEIIDAVLNHVKQGVVSIYNRHGYDEEKQQALIAWETKLNSIVGTTPITVYEPQEDESTSEAKKGKKRGRPARNFDDGKGSWTFEHVENDAELNRTLARDAAVKEMYDELITQGVRSEKAKDEIAEKLAVGRKTVERILSYRSHVEKEIRNGTW